MTARKPTSTFLFALTLMFAAALSGHPLLSCEAAQLGSSDNKVPSVAQAEDDLRNVTWKFDRANKEAQDAKDKANRTKTEADKLAERALRNGVDISDPSSKTAQARVAQKQAEDEAARAATVVEAAKRDVDMARANLEAARDGATSPVNVPPPSGQPKVEEGFLDSSYALLFPGALSLLGFAVMGALFWLTWKKVERVEENTGLLIRALAKRQDAKFQELAAEISGVKELNHKLVVRQDDMFRLMRTEESRPAAYSSIAALAAPAAPADDFYFPITADNFLSSAGWTKQIIRRDPLSNMLVKDPSRKGALVLVQADIASDKELYIIPRITRFQATEDFYNHYEKFYDCARPGAGEVWVNQLAVVDSVEGGWRLIEKGELEVKT
jgi:hypothetical protein